MCPRAWSASSAANSARQSMVPLTCTGKASGDGGIRRKFVSGMATAIFPTNSPNGDCSGGFMPCAGQARIVPAHFDQATAWLVTHKVLLPGATVLERAIARVRGRANSRLWRLLAARITADHKERLDALLVVPGNARQSSMDRLRSGPVLQSAPELARAIKRLDEVRELAKGLPHTDKLPKTRILALARFANAAKAQAVSPDAGGATSCHLAGVHPGA